MKLALQHLTAVETPQRPVEIAVRDTTANPAPLGLLGFGLTTVLLNLHNAGFVALGSTVLAMGICYGGLAQVVAGLMEWKKKNTFGTVAFTSYGFFWLSLVALIVLPKLGLAEKSDHMTMAAYLLMWGLLTFILLLGTFRTNVALVTVFFLLTVLFLMLGVADATQNAALTRIAGIEGLATGFAAIYLAAAQILNEVYGREVLPIGKLG